MNNTPTLKTLFDQTKSSSKGLTQQAASKRLQHYGPNKIVTEKKKNWLFEFLQEFKDLMVAILLISSVIAFFSGEQADATVIFAIVILNACIGFFQKYKAEKALEALKKMISPHAVVLRNGKRTQIFAEEIVPGDILIVQEGDTISADAKLIEAENLKVQESVLTGESLPVLKQLNQEGTGQFSVSTLYTGTQVVNGNGMALVFATGMETEFGKIAHLTATTEKDRSPLEKEMIKIGVFVGKLTLAMSAILVLVGIFVQGHAFIDSLIFAISVAVAAVPEGLPATITISLALGVQRLAKQKAIIKKLSSTETLGATTVICSDKTGTLTKNEMTVTEAHTLDNDISVSGNGYRINGKWEITGERIEKTITHLCRCIVLNNNAELNTATHSIIGDPTEGALIVFAEKSGCNRDALKKKFKKIKEFPFDSDRKMMTTTYHGRREHKWITYSKGAPENIVAQCSHVLIKGKKTALTTQLKKKILKQNQEMAKKALRVLACAFKENEKSTDQNTVEKDLIYIGLVGMIDPPREEVAQAIALTKKAGITTHIVTGDFSLTAAAIAEQIGLIEKDSKNCITGDELEKMSNRDLRKILKKKESYIFSRVSPSHKLKIVEALKKNQEIVAVTGDGVNDAPALKRADIGISMGITGTDVSKAAANMVLTDDSFATIVTAVKEGRTIYNNMKKFIYYIFSCNIGELLTVFTAIILAIPMPLTAVLILAVDVGTDILPALALGFDPSEPDIMDTPPRPVNAKILSKQFIINFILPGIYIGTLVIIAYFYVITQDGWQYGEEISPELYMKGTTFAFVALVIIQMFHSFNSRSLHNSIFQLGIFSNRKLIGAIVISVVGTILITEIPFFQNYLKITALSGHEWLLITLLSSTIIIVDEIKKFFMRRYA